MTLKFPPITQSPWEAPNGAIYEWDGEKWVVFTTQSIYVRKTGDEMSGDLLLKDKAGDPALYDDTTDPTTAVNKKYVDQQDDLLLQGIIDVQEEIDAIAPSTDKGAWEFDQVEFIANNVNAAPDTGKYLLLSGDAPNWTLTDEYNKADAVVFNKVDYNGYEHSNWDAVGEDKEIILLDKPDEDRVYGAITNILDIGEADNPYGDEAAVVIFDRFEGKGKPNNRPDPSDLFITFVNIFEPPSGGSGEEFVMKIGGNDGGHMTGYLSIDMSADGPAQGGSQGKQARLLMKGDRTGTTNPACSIEFNNPSSVRDGQLSYYSGNTAGEERFDMNRKLQLHLNGEYGAGALMLEGKRDNTTNSCATIEFKNSKFDNKLGYLTYRADSSSQFFKFDRDVQFNDQNLSKIKDINLSGPGTISVGNFTAMRFRSAPGSGNGNSYVEVKRPNTNSRKGFAIRGKNTSNAETDIFYSYTNGSGGDSVDYVGRITGDNHLVNKKYVDDKAGVELWNQSSPPNAGTRNRGHLLLTSNNGFYIYL
nr:hypothetical protein 4 [Paracoccaceae bacterium]